MRSVRPVGLGALLFLVACGAGQHRGSASRHARDDPSEADLAFKDARFDEAQRLYTQRAVANPGDAAAATRLGALALLQNNLPVAESALLRARSLDPGSQEVATLLAQAYVRRDAFTSAVPVLRAAGRNDRARQLETFGGDPPYVMAGPDEADVPFLTEDPLPLIEARGPDGAPLVMLIDTGGGEVILDGRVAARLGVVSVGEGGGVVAGGVHVSVGRGSLGALSFGPITIRRLPVDIGNTTPAMDAFGGRRIDGIVGTVALYHFLATLDYPGRRLVLRKRKGENRQCVNGARVPFLLAGDHFMISRGGMGPLRDMVWLVDTGLADGGFSGPESTIRAAGIVLDHGRAERGSYTEEIPFVVPELSLGPVTAHDVAGVFDGEFPIPKMLGFRVDGLVSHTFFKPYAVTFDFDRMELCLQR